MRIAVVAHNSHRVGGIETYVGRILPALRRRRMDVAYVFESSEGLGEPVLSRDEGIASWTAPGAMRVGLDRLRRWAPDVLFVHGLRSPELEREILALAPAVFFAHAYYGTCISGLKMHAAPGVSVCARRFGWPCLPLFYLRRCGGVSPVTMVRQYRLQGERLRLLAEYRRILVASRHMEAEFTRHGLGDRLRVVGLPADDPAGVAALGVDPTRWRLLYLGRLEWAKGPDRALRAAAFASAALSRRVELTIAGEGPMRRALEFESRELMGRYSKLTVAFSGWLPASARDAALQAADLLLVPSRWPEPFGLIGLEAARRGVPSVAFDVGGIRDWLQHGETGILVEPAFRAVRRFAAAIVGCLRDLGALQRMGERARAHAATFALDRHVEQLESILAETAAGDLADSAPS